MSEPSPESSQKGSWWRKLLLLVGAVALIFAAGVLFFDITGRRAWRAATARPTADAPTEVSRPLLPDEQNFCAVEPLKNIAATEEAAPEIFAAGEAARQQLAAALQLTPQVEAASRPRGLTEGTAIDFEALVVALRTDNPSWMPALPGAPVHDVAHGLSKWDPLFTSLAGGLARPGGRWTPPLPDVRPKHPWSRAGHPHLLLVEGLAQRLTLRAIAAGRDGDMRTAVACLQIAARLARATADDPWHIDQETALHIRKAMAEAIWELCRAHVGSPTDWVDLEGFIVQADFNAKALAAFRKELQSTTSELIEACDPRDPAGHDFVLGERLLRALQRTPRGVREGIAAEIMTQTSERLIRPLRAQDLPGLYRAGDALRREVVPGAQWSWNIPGQISSMVLREYARWGAEILIAQALARTMATACVLERAHASTGSYPGTLAGLTLVGGKPLPVDPFTGDPLHYRPTEIGRYVLWSVGLDGEDNHGSRKPAEGSGKGDLVWGFEP